MDSTEQLGLDLMTETGKKSRGGLSDYSELKKESVQRVRGDFLSVNHGASAPLARRFSASETEN